MDGAAATGIAGDRLFPSTLTIEDTQNDDELALPTLTSLSHGADDELPAGRELGLSAEYSRLLTPDLAASVATGWRRRGATAGWDNVELGLKYRTLVNERHELLVSTMLDYEIGGTGAHRIGAERFDTVQAIVSFGKGFGDLPSNFEWLRPAAITGAAGLAFPTGSGPKLARYGVSLQYSLLYRDRHTRLPTPPWAASLIPLVEIAVQTPVGHSYGSRTLATISPGIAWIGKDVQLTGALLVPLNRHTGRGIGAIAEVHFFLDEIAPALFGRPVFGGND